MPKLPKIKDFNLSKINIEFQISIIENKIIDVVSLIT